MQLETKSRTVSSPDLLLSKATLRAAHLLHLSNAELSDVLGVSEASLSRASNTGAPLSQNPKVHEVMALFIRLYRSLDAITGGDDAVSASWLRNQNTALGTRPITAIRTLSGLFDTIAYLDARRAVV